MTDPYHPPLNTFVLTTAEAHAIKAALLTSKPWDDADKVLGHAAILANLKKRLRTLHLDRHCNTCCYCKTNLHGAGHFMIDREHVLPKQKFKALSYEVVNISISCKRCNMEYKGNHLDFIIDQALAGTSSDNGANYLLVHPNYDRWTDHLRRSSRQVNEKVLVKYTVRSADKGRYTYDYFDLKQMEIDSFDKAQGLKGGFSALATRVRQIAKFFGQLR